MTEHLTSRELSQWRAGATGAAELLRLDDHLAGCSQCRALTAEDAGPAIRMLQATFSPGHLTELQLDSYAAHQPLPADVMQHLDACIACRNEAEDLRKFVLSSVASAPSRPSFPIWLRSMAAAVGIVALGLTAWFSVNRQNAPGNQPPKQLASNIQANIPAPYRDEIRAAMDSGNLHVPPSIAAMAQGPVQLRSAAVKESALHVLSPLDTAVVDDTPLFRWTAVPGATYSVSVYDDQFRSVAGGVSLKGTEWRPEKPLPRGMAYRWEVRAVQDKHVDSAPAPTDPEARFVVLGGAEAQRLTDARSAAGGDLLALGILYADAGALDDAKRELSAAAASGDARQKSLAEHLLGQLK